MLLFLLACLAYVPSLGGSFMWDDDFLVQFNPIMDDLGGLFKIWFQPGPDSLDYFPLTYSAFWIQKWFWSNWAGGYRIVNVLLHALSALQLWRLLGTLRLPGAWAAALVFALHPVNVESVAWIAELKNLLALVLLLPALEAYVRYEQTGVATHYRRALVFYLLSLLAKPSVVGLPMVVWLYLYWARGRLPGWADVKRLLPFVLAGIAFGLVTIHFQHQHAIGDEAVKVGDLLARTAGAGMAVWFYLGKAVLPWNLASIYPQWDYNPPHLWQLGAAALVPIVAALCWWRRDGWGRHFGFALGAFLMLVAPALGFVKMAYMRHSLVADHFQHLALPAVVALVVCGGTALLQRAAIGWRVRHGVLAGIAVTLGLAAWVRAGVHHDEERLWSDTLRKNPDSWQAYSRLGNYRLRYGQKEAAIRLFSEGLTAPSINGEVQHNLGSMLTGVGRFEEAAVMFRNAIERAPRLPHQHHGLITCLIALQRNDDAVEAIQQGLAVAGDLPEMQATAGFCYLLMKQPARALVPLQEAVRLNPKHPRYQTNLGVALHNLGQKEAALRALRKALALRPDYSAAAEALTDAIDGKPELAPTYAQ